MFEILQVTAQYSNAVLVAVMPYVADFAKKLELPIPQPVTIGQVAEFKCSPRSDLFGGRVILTNGYEFAFLHGHIEMYRNPRSYYELQDPDLVPKFFGAVKLKEKDAIRIAHDALKRLGYTDAMLDADRPPRVTLPARVGKEYVARYRVWWGDPSQGNPTNAPTSADIEVDASTGQIHMMYLLSSKTWRDSPKVNVHPPVIGQSAQTAYRNGHKVLPVSHAYSNAFLAAILPQCSEYIRAGGFRISTPITAKDVNMEKFNCGVVDNDPTAFLDLKNGARFVYRHGQVIAFYAPDVTHLPGEDWKQPVEKFFGPINITGPQAAKLVRQTVKRLGYSEKVLHLDERPLIGGPARRGTNTIARYSLDWKESEEGAFRVCAEVDATTKTVKSLYINDHAITNIWRKPPRIDVPATEETNALPSSSSASTTLPSLPPATSIKPQKCRLLVRDVQKPL